MKKIFSIFWLYLFLFACATNQITPSSKINQTIPSLTMNQVIVPPSLYSTAKGKTLAINYQKNLENIFSNIRAKYSPEEIEFAPLRVLPDGKVTSGLGFFRVVSESEEDIRYLGLSVGTSHIFDTAATALSIRVSTVISKYVKNLLEIMIKEKEAVDDRDVVGIHMGLGWHSGNNYSRKTEGIVLQASKENVVQYLNQKISTQEFVNTSRIVGFQGNNILGKLEVKIDQSFQISEGYTPITKQELNIPKGYIPKGYTPITKQKDEKFYVRYDEFKNISFIRHKYFFGTFAYPNTEPIEIYEVKNSNLRLVFEYIGWDWIFFQKATLINSSGKKIEFNFKSYNKTTDVISGDTVYESIDLYLSDSKAKALLILLSTPGNKKIRLSGKYQEDYILDKNRIIALKEIIDHYFNNR